MRRDLVFTGALLGAVIVGLLTAVLKFVLDDLALGLGIAVLITGTAAVFWRVPQVPD